MANRTSRNNPSLVELVVALGLVGVIVVLAMPLHQSYSSRARVSEALVEASRAKLSIAEYMASTDGAKPPEASGVIHDATGNQARQIAYDGEKIIIKVEVEGGEEALVLCLEPLWNPPDIDWRCSASGNTRYAPAHCRGHDC